MLYNYDSKGRMSLVRTKAILSAPSWTVIANGYSYEPFAAVKTMTLGNTLSVANDWGNDGRLASRRLYKTSGGANLSWLAYGYDANDNVTSIVDMLNDANSIWYGYDSNDRMTQTALTAGTVQTGTDTYSYATGTNRLSSIANTGGTRTLGLDARSPRDAVRMTLSGLVFCFAIQLKDIRIKLNHRRLAGRDERCAGRRPGCNLPLD